MHVPSFIERKRNGHELTEEDIAAFIAGFTEGSIPDYQASAWAMAVFFRGMTPAETRFLTRAMLRSGQTLTYPAGTPPKVDKHSTGGVGDKVSLMLAPILAACGAVVPMISGRAAGSGLGLSIAQAIVSQHQGTIECTSEPGRTRFAIMLPVEPAAPEPPVEHADER